MPDGRVQYTMQKQLEEQEDGVTPNKKKATKVKTNSRKRRLPAAASQLAKPTKMVKLTYK